jgi:hypothetical protein
MSCNRHPLLRRAAKLTLSSYGNCSLRRQMSRQQETKRVILPLAAAVALIVVTAVATAGALSVRQATAASRGHVYWLKEGDTAVLNGARVKCTAFNEGGAPELYCRKSAGGPKHEVSFFRNQIFVYANGQPDKPVWSGTP